MNPIEGWFVADEPVEILVAGVRLKAREIPADTYMRLVRRATRGGTVDSFDPGTYGTLLIQEMVVEPELTEEDLARLKPGIKATLIRELEGLLGVSPDALKNDLVE